MGYTKFHSYLYNCTTKGKPIANPKGTETDIVCWLRNEALQLQCASLKGTSTTVLQTLPAAPVNVLTGPVTASIAVRKVKLKVAPVAVRSRRSVSPNFPCWTRNTTRGQFDLIDLGEAPPCGVAPEHWRHPVPSVPGGYVQLRDGLRVRKHFQLGDLAGKTFDWCVVQDRSLTRQGRPLYKIWQVSQDPESGFAISKRAEVAHSPYQMWNDVFCRHTGKKNSCHDASGMCGFKEPDVVALLRLSESAIQESNSRKQRRKQLRKRQPQGADSADCRRRRHSNKERNSAANTVIYISGYIRDELHYVPGYTVTRRAALYFWLRDELHYIFGYTRGELHYISGYETSCIIFLVTCEASCIIFLVIYVYMRRAALYFWLHARRAALCFWLQTCARRAELYFWLQRAALYFWLHTSDERSN
jgi:hypothetical protein